MDHQYVRIRSWHVVLTPTRMFDTYRTLCGRTAVTKDVRDVLPGGKSCESCARIALRAADPAPVPEVVPPPFNHTGGV